MESSPTIVITRILMLGGEWGSRGGGAFNSLIYCLPTYKVPVPCKLSPIITCSWSGSGPGDRRPSPHLEGESQACHVGIRDTLFGFKPIKRIAFHSQFDHNMLYCVIAMTYTNGQEKSKNEGLLFVSIGLVFTIYIYRNIYIYIDKQIYLFFKHLILLW